MDVKGDLHIVFPEVSGGRVPAGPAATPVREAMERRPIEKLPDQLRVPEKLQLEDLEKLTEALNRMSDFFRTEIRFFLHREPDFTVIRVMDMREGKIIRAIPPDEVVKMIERLHDFLGFLIDKRA